MRFAILVALIAYTTFGVVQLVSAAPFASPRALLSPIRQYLAVTRISNQLKSSTAEPMDRLKRYKETNTGSKEDVKQCMEIILAALKTSEKDLKVAKASPSGKRQTDDGICDCDGKEDKDCDCDDDGDDDDEDGDDDGNLLSAIIELIIDLLKSILGIIGSGDDDSDDPEDGNDELPPFNRRKELVQQVHRVDIAAKALKPSP